jgi:hypothetical protein
MHTGAGATGATLALGAAGVEGAAAAFFRSFSSELIETVGTRIVLVPYGSSRVIFTLPTTYTKTSYPEEAGGFDHRVVKPA